MSLTEAPATPAPDGGGNHGEQLVVPERVILAPAVGVFQPSMVEADSVEGNRVTEGEVVGVVEARGTAHPVRSAFTGLLVGLLAHPGERVRKGQPVAWLRVS